MMRKLLYFTKPFLIYCEPSNRISFRYATAAFLDIHPQRSWCIFRIQRVHSRSVQIKSLLKSIIVAHNQIVLGAKPQLRGVHLGVHFAVHSNHFQTINVAAQLQRIVDIGRDMVSGQDNATVWVFDKSLGVVKLDGLVLFMEDGERTVDDANGIVRGKVDELNEGW